MARFQGKKAGTILVDCTKFYDTVGLAQLVDSALDLDYPPHLLAMAVSMYIAPRMVKKHGIVDAGQLPWNSMVAGCGQAVSLARALLYRPLHGAIVEFPLNKFRQFVDDILIKRVGRTDQEVANDISRAFGNLAREMGTKGCKISPKTAVSASSSRLATMIQQGLGKFGWAVRRSSHPGTLALAPHQEEGGQRTWHRRDKGWQPTGRRRSGSCSRPQRQPERSTDQGLCRKTCGDAKSMACPPRP